jgi:hypothetical protein
MSLIISLQTALLNRLFGSGGVVRIGTGSDSYVGVCISDPGDTGSTVNEADYGGRKQILSSGWGAPSSGQIKNSVLLAPWVVTAGPTLLQHFLLGDTGVVNSTHDFSAPLLSTVLVVPGDQVRFPVDSLVIQVDGLLTHTYGHDQLDMLLRNLTPTQPTNYYWALSTTTPSADGTGFTEPSGNGYGRVGIARGYPFGSAVSGSPSTISNTSGATTALIEWPLPTGAWGTVTHWGAFDAPTGGNLLIYGALDTPTAVPLAAPPSFEYGDLTLTME